MTDFDEAGMVVATVTIIRKFYPDRPADESETIRVDTQGDPTLIDILGMLEFAKMDAMTPAIRSEDDGG